MFSYLWGSNMSYCVFSWKSNTLNLLSSCGCTEILLVSSNTQLLVSTNIFLATESGINWVHCFAKLWTSFTDIIEHGCERQTQLLCCLQSSMCGISASPRAVIWQVNSRECNYVVNLIKVNIILISMITIAEIAHNQEWSWITVCWLGLSILVTV